MDVGGSRVVVSKDIHTAFPLTTVATPMGPPIITRTGTLKAEGSVASEDEVVRAAAAKDGGQKSEFTAKTDSADNLFMEDVSLSQQGGRQILTILIDHIIHIIPFLGRAHTDALYRIRHAIRSSGLAVRGRRLWID